MEGQNVSNEVDIDSKRPGGVALAAIWLMISSGAAMVSLLIGSNLSGLFLAVIAFFLVALVTSFAVIALKKWAYWVFLSVVVLLGLNNLSDSMLLALGISPDTNFQISHVTSVIIPLAVAAYFCTQTVRQAFGVNGLSSN